MNIYRPKWAVFYNVSMAYRKIPMSRRKLLEYYYYGGKRQSLRFVANKMGISPNTVRNWLITFGIYSSERKKIVKSIDNT